MRDAKRAAGVPGVPGEVGAEERLASLAASSGAARRVLAAIVARVVETRAYERLCYARLGDYARERAGVSGRQMQELARVHRAFQELPRLERALLRNELPWSKVRLLVRVADSESEGAWVALARRRGVRELARLVAEAGGEKRGVCEATSRVSIRCSVPVREKWDAVCELAERVAGRRISESEAFEMVVAEACSAVAADADASPDLAPVPREFASEREAAMARASAVPLPVEVATLVDGLEDADAFELDRRLRVVVHFEQTLDSQVGPLLRVVSSPEHEWRGDFQPLARYAPEQLGMSARKARALLRLERIGDACPELREAYRDGRLTWEKAQCLAPLLGLDLDGEWRPVWVAWANGVTLRRLEQDVARALLLRAGHHLAWHRCKFDPARAQDAIPPAERQMCARDVDTEATEEMAWRVPREVAALFRALCEKIRGCRLDGEVFEALLDHAHETWTLREPGSRRTDPVIERDGYHCAVPGCTSRSSLHDHHIVFRSAGGSHAPANRLTLCAFHHQRGVHAGLMHITGSAPDGLTFDLPLARYASGDLELTPRSALPARRAAGRTGGLRAA